MKSETKLVLLALNQNNVLFTLKIFSSIFGLLEKFAKMYNLCSYFSENEQNETSMVLLAPNYNIVSYKKIQIFCYFGRSMQKSTICVVILYENEQSETNLVLLAPY